MSEDSGGAASSVVRRWQLAERLRELREAAGHTVEEAAEELRKGPGRWSKSKLSRIEHRTQTPKPREVEQILDAYRVTDADTRQQLLEFAETANQRGWWDAHRANVAPHFVPKLTLEPALTGLRQFETVLVPGLMQTADYSRALISGIEPGLAADEVERRVIGRMARQQILLRDDPLQLHVILDEAVLQRPVGKPAVMRAQLRRLAELAAEPTITIQVLLRSAGPHPGMEGPFEILSLPEPLPDVGYVEGIGGTIYLEAVEDVRRCTLAFGILTSVALPAAESARLIEDAVASIR